MPRKGPVRKRPVTPDPVYNNIMVARFISRMTLGGKKSVSERIFYGALDNIGKKANRPGLEVFELAIRNVMPVVEVKPRRVGGQTYQVPVEVRPERRNALAMKWLVGYSRNRGEKSMAERLAAELLGASRNEGASIKKKEDTHRMAEANKAFAHYRW